MKGLSFLFAGDWL